jgi:nitroimidazol reductase NimA-like FMN-containing flavoprotein (pyridoxamine 5'-phosphate oxidase superfamily)
MRSLRRKEKAIKTQDEMVAILENAKYITVAMCLDSEPYLATLSHGYDRERNCLYFHCAQEGKKVDILQQNSVVWGQALLDKGYVQGACDHLFATTQFMGKVTFVVELAEKRHALEVMIEGLEREPGRVKAMQLTEETVKGVAIGRIDIDYMSGKKSEEVIISGMS